MFVSHRPTYRHLAASLVIDIRSFRLKFVQANHAHTKLPHCESGLQPIDRHHHALPHALLLPTLHESLRLFIAEVIGPPFLKSARPEPTFDTQVFRLTQI